MKPDPPAVSLQPEGPVIFSALRLHMWTCVYYAR